MDLTSVSEVEIESALALERLLSCGALVVWYLCVNWKNQCDTSIHTAREACQGMS